MGSPVVRDFNHASERPAFFDFVFISERGIQLRTQVSMAVFR